MHPLPLDRLTDEARDRVALVVALYLVVLGRPPDPGGLADYTRHLAAGVPLEALAADFLRSGEFVERAGGRKARQVLSGDDVASDGDEPIEGLAARLARHRAAGAVLPALFPDGVPMTDAGYRTWLAFQPDQAPRRGDSSTLLIDAEGAEIDALASTVASAVSAGAETVLVARWPGARRLRLALGRQPGLRVLSMPPWAGRAARLRKGLSRATRSFVALARPGDRLHLGLLDGHDASVLLFDADALDDAGLRHAPRFGTAWDPDFVADRGFDGTFFADRALLTRVGLRDETETDLLLRAAAAAGEGAVRHRPIVAMTRAGSPVERRPRLDMVSPDPAPHVAAIIPTRNRADLLRACVSGLLDGTDYAPLEVVIVDNGSTDPDALALLTSLAAHPRVKVLAAPGPFNWSALNNLGVAATQADIVALLNNDLEMPRREWLRAMVAEASRPGTGAVGAKLLYPGGTVQHAGVVLSPSGHALHLWRGEDGEWPGYRGLLATRRRVAAVTGACLVMRRSVFLQAGGCDAEAFPVTWNDVDLCFRVRRLGLHCVWTPEATLTHVEQATRGSDDTPENHARFLAEQERMRERWGSWIDTDPFWSPNLRAEEGPLRLRSGPA